MNPNPLLDRLTLSAQLCQDIRDQHEALRNAPPLIRLWMNDPSGASGAIYIGRADYTDTLKGSFPFKNNTPTQGVLELRDDHYLAVWLKRLPNDTSLLKNVLITVDFYGTEKRWSGLLDKWTVKSKDGVKYLEVTFHDDLTQLQYLLCPPNPILPIPIFQFPRIFALAGPAKWCISAVILLNLLRVEGNLWTLPDDPFDFEQWTDILDWSQWQVHIKCDPFLLDDSSLWTFLSARMTAIDAMISDAMDDAQMTMQYRRIITDDGETTSGLLGIGENEVKNGALVLEVVDNSNASALSGTFLQGTIIDGFVRSVITYGGGFVEDTFNEVADDESLMPDEYYQSGWLASMAAFPWLVVRDNEWTSIESSELSWGPSKNVSVIVGGDNPAADAIAKLIIETTGNILSYFLLFGWSGGGTMAADIIMPFIVGTIAAWLQWKNNGRAIELGWMHYWELLQQGAENNSWSLAALAALRGGFLAGQSETIHVMAMHDSWAIPGLHFDVGYRIGSTLDSAGLENIIWINQVDEMTPAWDNSQSIQPYAWEIKVGKSTRAMSMGERFARLAKKFDSAVSSIGVQLIAS